MLVKYLFEMNVKLCYNSYRNFILNLVICKTRGVIQMKKVLNSAVKFMALLFSILFSIVVVDNVNANGLDPITINIVDKSGLDSSVATVWVAGWINGSNANSFKVLQADGTFGGSSPSTVPYYSVSSISKITLRDTTNGNDRLIFVVSKDTPAALQVTNSSPTQYTQYPYISTPGVVTPGPFDIFEFGYDAAANLSAVSGFGLNLSFTANINNGNPSQEQYGTTPAYSRSQIGKAFKTFITNEGNNATPFAELFYDSPITQNAPQPPLVGGQYFAICDPNDMLVAKTSNYQTASGDALETYWDSILNQFFQPDNYLSINISANPAVPNIYSGQCIDSQTNNARSPEPVTSPAYILTSSDGKTTYIFYKPLPSTGIQNCGLTGARYVFQQAYGQQDNLTPAGCSGDAGLLQDNIWEAICRGVAMLGVSELPLPVENLQRPGTIQQTGILMHQYVTITPSFYTIALLREMTAEAEELRYLSVIPHMVLV